MFFKKPVAEPPQPGDRQRIVMVGSDIFENGKHLEGFSAWRKRGLMKKIVKRATQKKPDKAAQSMDKLFK